MAKTLPKRKLGSSGIEVSAIGLGCMSLSGIYGKTGDDEGIALIHEALDNGVTFLDSSDAYGAGHNEELVGKALKGRRSGVVLATKFGNLGGRDGKFADGRPEFVIEFLREKPQAARRRRDRSLLPAPHRSERADRGHRRRHGQARAAGQSARARHQRSEPRHHPPRACDASARRRAERAVADLPRRRRRDAWRPRASSISLSSPIRRSAAAS